MVNRSFEEALFPDAVKVAVVKPILKKSILDPFDLKSWRPISNIGFVVKIIERIAIQRFNSHVNCCQCISQPTDHAIQPR